MYIFSEILLYFLTAFTHLRIYTSTKKHHIKQLGENEMKAAVFLGNQTVEIQDIPQPIPQNREILLKVHMCGICGTDAHIFSGELQVAKPPVVLGHEVSGEIVDLGKNVKGFNLGEKVSIDPVVTCGQCEYCHTGRTNLCEQQTVIGYVRNGGFAQYMTAPVSHVYRLDDSTNARTGILVETLACVLNGVDRLRVRPASSALILGAGTVGLLWNQLLKNSAATILLQTDLIKFRRQKAKVLGADFIFDGADSELDKNIQTICPEGVDFIIDATGNPKAVEQAIPWVRKNGTFMIFGVCPEDAQIQISPFELYQREIKIIASKMPPGTLDRSSALLASGAINVEEIVTTVLPLDSIAQGFQMFSTGKDQAVKIAINPWI
jgi:2-desacetyl-2-hydroxyethyl bacteriochlorophyllide A dehydrogenase